MEYPADLATRLRRARRLADLSQDELGLAIGKSQQSIQRYETNGLPRNERQADKLLHDWAEATGMQVEDLVGLPVRDLIDLPGEAAEPEPAWVGRLEDQLTLILAVLRRAQPEAAAQAAMELLGDDEEEAEAPRLRQRG